MNFFFKSRWTVPLILVKIANWAYLQQHLRTNFHFGVLTCVLLMAGLPHTLHGGIHALQEEDLPGLRRRAQVRP